MHEGGDGGGSAGGGGLAGDQQSEPAEPVRQRAPHVDSLDPRGPMGMPKIVSRVAERLGHGPQGAGNVMVWMYLLSVLAIMIAFGIFFIVGGH